MTSSKTLHAMRWVVQVLLAAVLIWAACMKLFTSIAALSQMWPWTGEVSIFLVKGTGVVDLLAGAGLVLPMLFRIRPGLTPVAAVCLIVLMIAAAIFHVARGDAFLIGMNIVFAVLAAFVAWGRWKPRSSG